MKQLQHSFDAGEISPGLLGRTDIKQYAKGAARLRNFFVDLKGGASRRAGTRFVGNVRYPNLPTVLIPFHFSFEQNYLLEFGHLYMRVIRNGGYVVEPSKTITGATNANPGVITSTAHGFVDGNWVEILNVGGMTQLNRRVFIVAGATANTFQLNTVLGAAVDTTAYGTYTSGGVVARIYTIATPYASTHVRQLNYTQSADVMTITHPSYEPRDLSRTAHDAWTLSVITWGSALAHPGTLTVTTNSTLPGPATGYSYLVTSVDDNGDESLVGGTPGAIITASWYDDPSMSNEITWATLAGAVQYNVYRAAVVRGRNPPAGAFYSFIGNTSALSFVDQNIGADISTSPPNGENPFNATNLYPGCAEYFQQRKVFARSNSFPMTLWFTQPGRFRNLNTSIPTRDDNAIVATLAARQVNEVKHLIALTDSLIALTSGSIFRISAGGDAIAITPASIQADPQVYSGSSDVRPLIVGHDIFYVQSRGSVVRSLFYVFQNNTYKTADMTTLASHLIAGRQIVSWTYAEEPHKTIWATRDDGVALCFTYLQEQEVGGWTWHDTQGEFEWVTSIVEGTRDVPYFIVRRKVAGGWYQIVEQMQPRHLTQGLESAWFVDCGVARGPSPQATGLEISAATGTVTLTAESSVFSVGNIGDFVHAGGGKVEITAYTSGTVVTGLVINPITTVVNGVPSYFLADEWALGNDFTLIFGLDHLEGMVVWAMGDGVVSGPYTVVGGTITLPVAVSVAVVGLTHTAQLQTLPIDSESGPDGQGYFKKVSNVIVRMHESRGVKYGNSFTELMPMKEDNAAMYSKDREVILMPRWDTSSQLCFEVTDPYPVTILGVIPDALLSIPDKNNRFD